MAYPYDSETEPVYSTPPDLANTLTGPVVVPLAQAGITGFLIAVALTVVVGITRLSLPVHKFELFAGIWAVATLVAWLMFRQRWQHVIETVLGVDINRDGHIGDPPEPEIIEVHVTEEEGRHLSNFDLPYQDRLTDLARGILKGKPFTEEQWTPRHKNGFSKPEFVELRKQFIAREMAAWKDEAAHDQGVVFTRKGMAILRALAARKKI
jgi:hypothetical protein